jgi:hypothetical protein
LSSAPGYAGWAALAAAALALWAWARSPRAAIARPAAVLARLASGPLLRVLLVLAWTWLGWHLFAR